MSIPSVYINLEDDVSKIVTRIKHQTAKQLVLVCPKRCFLFNDSINLRLLKKQADILGKEIFILTMDEKGQLYAKEAGFELKFLPKSHAATSFSDIKVSKKIIPPAELKPVEVKEPGVLEETVEEIKHIAKKIIPEKNDFFALVANPEKSKNHKTSHVPKVMVSDSIFPLAEFADNKDGNSGKGRWVRILTGFVVITLITALVLVFVVLPKATVVAVPKSEPVTRDMEISFSSAAKDIDVARLVLPAQPVTETLNLSGKFQSQGKRQMGNKASGSVKIYNFTRQPINLKSSTTVLMVGSKTYTLNEDLSGVKPTAYSNAKTKEVDQNSLGAAVEILATAGGEDFNLPAGTRMEISNQVFGSKPQFLYAKTETEISGGTTRYLSLISQDDVDKAKDNLLTQAIDEVAKKIAANHLVMPDKAYTIEVLQFTTDNAVGTETPGFSASLQVKISGLAYSVDDLNSLINQRIAQTISGNKNLRPKSDTSTVVKLKTIDFNNQLGVISVHYEGQALFNIDLKNVSAELVGKSLNDVNEILRSKAEIERVDITLAPVWQKNFPLFASKIKIIVGQDQN